MKRKLTPALEGGDIWWVAGVPTSLRSDEEGRRGVVLTSHTHTRTDRHTSIYKTAVTRLHHVRVTYEEEQNGRDVPRPAEGHDGGGGGHGGL